MMHNSEIKKASSDLIDLEESKLLKVRATCHSDKGVKAKNEDSVGLHIPDNSHQLNYKGVLIAIADGVSSAEAGREASQTAIQHFIQEYFATPDTWSVSHAGQKILTAINLKLFRKSHEFSNEEKGYLCTFSGLIIKSRIAHIFHAGDSRIYRFRNENFECLTRDHTAHIGQGRNILARAVGMDNSLQIDYSKHPIQAGDKFLLTTDGVHDFIEESQLKATLNSSQPIEYIPKQLLDIAIQNGSDDNVSCAICEVEQLPDQSLDDFNLQMTRLPFPPALEPGVNIDGFIVEKEIFSSSRSQLYLVTDTADDNQYVMKTPSVNFEDDISYIDRFIQEEWIGLRISSPYVVAIKQQKRPRKFLYYLMEYVEGITLEEWMKNNVFPKPRIAIDIVDQIAKGLKAFHEQETIHQDLKPGNIMLIPTNNISQTESSLQVKIVDFGSVFVAGVAEVFRPIQHEGALGTATYSDPHYLLGKNSGIQGDLYSLATITYEIFTGKLPFGEKVADCQSAFDYDKLRYQLANQHNPVIPSWFDRALEKALTFNLENRYHTLESFLYDLHNPNPDFLMDDPAFTKEKNKAFFWQIISGFWLVTLILLYLLFSN